MPRKHPSTQKHREKSGRVPKKHSVFHTLRVGMWKTSPLFSFLRRAILAFCDVFYPKKVRSFQKFGDFGADYAVFIYEALILSQQRHIQASPCRKGHDSISALRNSEPRLYGRFSISEREKACPRNTFSALRRPDLSE